MNHLVQKSFLVVLVSSIASMGCSAQIDLMKELDHQMREMEASERRANERTGEELVAFMPLDVMFQNPELRLLAEAAGKGRVKKIRTFIGQGADVNARGNKGATVLFWAIREGSARGFRALLELDADPNVIFEDGGSVMHSAVRHRDPAFLKAALAHGGDPNLKADPLGRTPIFEALGERRDRLDLLLAAGADVNAESEIGMPAYVAARRGSFDVVYQLLEHGAEYRAKGSGGQTLLDIALEKKPMMDPNHDLYRWLQRTIAWLESDSRNLGNN